MNDKYRSCTICLHFYEGEYGECPKCDEAHKKSAKHSVFSGGSRKHGKPTLDVQEGNWDD